MTEFDTGCTPEPDRVIVDGELLASLLTVVLPFKVPVDYGVNVTFNVVVCPGFRMSPLEVPLTVYPAPETLTFEMVTLEFPAFVKVTPRVLLLPILTLPNDRLDELAFSSRVAAVTVNIAALLVVLPALLVTTTVNCALLSAVVVAGVV